MRWGTNCVKGGSIKDPSPLNKSFSHQCLAGRVFQYRVGSGRVPGIGSGSGRVGVMRLGISGYLFLSRVFSGISGISQNFG